jgi:hypothetical protein
MRDWVLSDRAPKNRRPSMRGAAKIGLYEPVIKGAEQPYEMTYEQRERLYRILRGEQ